MDPAAPVDLERVRQEIDAEVRARRAAGDYPPAFERELDALFERFSPPEASTDLRAAAEQAEEAVGLDPLIPTASNNAVLGIVKRVLAKLLGWYHAFVVQQVVALGGAIVHTLRLLVGRVERLEDDTGHLARAAAEVSRLAPDRDDAEWSETVVVAFRGVAGRVAVADAGDAGLLGALVAAGVDAYGVEPRAKAADAAGVRALEVRLDSAAGHLRAAGTGALDGVLLRGCVERMPAGEVLALADEVTRCLAPSGRLVVVSATPAAWTRSRHAVEADLALGRPLHPETWEWLLRARDFEAVEVHRAATPSPFGLLPASDPHAEIHNANIARLAADLYGPDSFVIVATRAASR